LIPNFIGTVSANVKPAALVPLTAAPPRAIGLAGSARLSAVQSDPLLPICSPADGQYRHRWMTAEAGSAASTRTHLNCRLECTETRGWAAQSALTSSRATVWLYIDGLPRNLRRG
jgi:hypothetical protein